ncbi:hypothetical protein [Confluentibacter sediminis]|uniref:hypothetical protein n=1 Tax=Confluentibacter sediminis TaxID=2219045 RepID=UPI000DAF26F5|nr:hypothetical protein [Confluentibacter sediminis]
MTEQEIEKGRKNAIISYLTIIGVIIAYYLNNEEENKSAFAGFHIRQSLGLWLTFYALGYMIGNFDSWLVTSSFYVFFAVLFIYGFITALNRKTQAVPLLGTFYQKLFKNFAN